MKKLILLSAFGVLTLMSCKKDYTCECTVTTHQPAFSYGGTEYQQESNSSTSASSTIKDKKDDAKSSCESKNGTTSTASPYASFGAGATTITTTCGIK